MKQSAGNYGRLVIKVGTSFLYPDGSQFDAAALQHLASQISRLVEEGREVVVVSSGAIAMGMQCLGVRTRPKDLHTLQAVAAVGQHELMHSYRQAFGNRRPIAQILLTWEDFTDRRRYLNAKNTLGALRALGSIPVINENDTISTDEIKFGDNDRLSALVASMIGADLLVMLTDVDGLLDRQGRRIPVVEQITAPIRSLACPTRKRTCVGGMMTKIDAAKIAMDSKIPCVIANGSRKGVLLELVADPQSQGTFFLPAGGHVAARQRWLAFGSRPQGKIIVDDGARLALRNKKSLLAVGVVSIIGDFSAGSVVSVMDSRRQEFAKGRVALDSRTLQEVQGRRHTKEVIHRDNLVLL